MKQNIWPDETDAALHEVAERYLKARYSFEARQKLTQGERRFDQVVWNHLADMGWLGLAVPEDAGGLGLRISSICLLAQAAGRSLLNEPFITSGVLAASLMAATGARDALLPKVISGELKVAPVFQAADLFAGAGGLSGTARAVMDADVADALLVPVRSGDGFELYLVYAAASGLTRTVYPLLDGRGGATLHFKRTPASRLDVLPSRAALQSAQALGALATAADSCGVMAAAFDLTLEYLKTRKQFGQTLGSHQVLQHRAVDIYIRLCESRAVLAKAIASMQAGGPGVSIDMHAAKAVVCENARLVTQEAIQLHGGFGITEEYAASHYLRRARVNEQLYGSAEFHFQAFASALAGVQDRSTLILQE